MFLGAEPPASTSGTGMGQQYARYDAGVGYIPRPPLVFAAVGPGSLSLLGVRAHCPPAATTGEGAWAWAFLGLGATVTLKQTSAKRVLVGPRL